ncbi:hypothetical protein ACHAXR_009033 [Thalassiosira sp. AJA248-18]
MSSNNSGAAVPTMMHSQLPGRPSFRNSAMHAVAIVPLTIPRKNSSSSSSNDNDANNNNNNAGDAAGGGGTTTASSNTNSTTTTSTTTTNHSEKSFHHLLDSLQEFATQGRMAHQRTTTSSSNTNNIHNTTHRKWRDESSEITLVLPHSQLTRPGDWRYDATPLKSHDWQSGCQRIRIFDGRPEFSRMAYDRIGNTNSSLIVGGGSRKNKRGVADPPGKKRSSSSSTKDNDNDNNAASWKDSWKDLEPHRTTSAVIGILNMKDCRDTRDLWRAEESLIQWARAYAHENDREDVALGAGDTRNILTRLFVFDSFEESLQQRVNLNQTRFQANQLVAFPPLDLHANSTMMVLHWNVVVNDLAVALFRNVERRIRENDVLGKSLVWDKQRREQQQQQQQGVGGGGGSSHGGGASSLGGKGGSGAGGQTNASGGVATLISGESSMTSTSEDTSQSTGDTSTADSGGLASFSSSPNVVGVGGRLRNAFDNTRKAIANRQESASSLKTVSGSGSSGYDRRESSSSAAGGGGGGLDRRKLANAKLVTPLDLDANNDMMASISAREIDALKRRDLGRREKRSADLSLLAGSPIDAYERYTRAAELTRHSHDPLWYASALEGCACAFIAMADAGGHGVDDYLENNFQLPEEIMALAIAQGVAAGADLGDGRGKTMTVDRTKTTLPQAVTALVEEAMSVLCRHEKLAPLHSGLLMKLAEYVQEEEEGHLRCRWGEGEYCYGGDLSGGAGDGSVPPRWERTTVSRLDLRGTEVREMLAMDSIERGRKFTELLHRAVSVGGLDDRSRADVAAACARACLIGTKETQWGDSNENSVHSRLRFPRKAAFFTLVAAEAMTRCECTDAAERASSLYLAASHLYSRQGNVFEHGDDCITRYGWATLRTATLQGLSSQPADKEVAEAATELLVALLNEISANQGAVLLPQIHGEDGQGGSFDSGDDYDRQTSFGDDSHHGNKANQSDGRRQVSRPLASMAKTPFFAQAPPSALSLSQSKWLEDDPVPHVQLPFVNAVSTTTADKSFVDRASALSSTVTSMSCVTAKINFSDCAKVQHICMANMKDLRQQMGASSDQEAGTIGVYDGGSTDESSLPPPLVITSAKIVKGESHLLLERAKAVGYSAKFATHSMSTFFNPYAKKQGSEEDKKKVQTTLIAEGEERTVMIEFKNRLAVPLEVPSCHLEFEGKGADRIEAPPLSFTVPAKTSSFAVHFPFIVAVSKHEPEKALVEEEKEKEGESESETEAIPEPDMFDVIGLRVTCLNRTFPIRLGKSEEDVNDSTNDNEIAQLPPSASVYQRSKHTQPKKDEQQLVVRLESVPAQPNLLVSFAASQSPMEEDASVPVHLSDGEIFTIPTFRLENDFGRSGMGEIERLQVLAVGLPGIPDETLFDTDALAAALEEEEDVLTETDSEAEEDFDEMMECDGLPPLKMKVKAEGLNLRSINDKSKNKGEGSIVQFQMAATHDMGDQLANGGNVRIRFRYRGPSPNPATEIWRKREVSLRIIRVKGPRISSLTFRSDLSWGSSYAELCNSLVMQRRRLDTTPKWESSNNRHKALSRSRSSFDSTPETESVVSGDEVDYSILNRVGTDPGVHVSSDEVVLLMAVANETSSTIILSNRKGLVGGFEGSPMPTVRITSGVSVKIPVVIPRIDRFDENGEVTDLAAELVSRTALQWESEAVEGADGTEKIKRTGRVRIPSRCLREIIDEHKSFASRICKPPVSLSVSVGGEPKQSEISLPLGSAIQVDANMTVQDWVPQDVVAKCKVTLEFCCAAKQSGNSSSANGGRMPYMWCGQLRRTIDLSNSEDDKSHLARIAFFQCGVFVVSVCAKVSSQDAPSGIEESWWAPHAKVVRVGELEEQ